jgi:hypothetical protein
MLDIINSGIYYGSVDNFRFDNINVYNINNPEVNLFGEDSLVAANLWNSPTNNFLFALTDEGKPYFTIGDNVWARFSLGNLTHWDHYCVEFDLTLKNKHSSALTATKGLAVFPSTAMQNPGDNEGYYVIDTIEDITYNAKEPYSVYFNNNYEKQGNVKSIHKTTIEDLGINGTEIIVSNWKDPYGGGYNDDIAYENSEGIFRLLINSNQGTEILGEYAHAEGYNTLA